MAQNTEQLLKRPLYGKTRRNFVTGFDAVLTRT